MEPPSRSGPAEIRWRLLSRVVDLIRYRPLQVRLALAGNAPRLDVSEPLARLQARVGAVGATQLRRIQSRVFAHASIPAGGGVGRRMAPFLEGFLRTLGAVSDGIGALLLEPSPIDTALLTPHTRSVAVLVLDMRNFSKLTAELDDTKYLSGLIEEYLTRMTAVIERHRGVVFQYTGDGLLALFLPELLGEEAGPMLERMLDETTRELHEEFDAMVARWKDDWRAAGRTGYAVGLGVGLSYGPATIGLLGSIGKKQFGVVGRPINMAAYLCSQALAGNVLVDKNSLDEVGLDVGERRVLRLRSPKLHQRIAAVSIRHGRTRAARRTIGKRISQSLGLDDDQG